MSYVGNETSLESGAPVELYQFTQGLQTWRYTSSASPVTYQSFVFKPSSISRDRVKQTGDVFKDSLKIELPRGDAFANQFLGFAPDTVTGVTIFRGHAGDSEFIPYWRGRVAAASADGNKITIDCESIFSSIRRPGLRARYELTCRHALYSPRCTINRDLFMTPGVAITVSGVTVEVAAAAGLPNGYFTAGILRGPDDATRFIVSHVGSVLTLQRPMYTLAGGDSVRLYPGCDKLMSTCSGKFNNLDNYGGFPWVPARNPYDGRSII